LSKACEIARAAEETLEQASFINNGQSSDVQAVYHHRRTNKIEQKQTICGKWGKHISSKNVWNMGSSVIHVKVITILVTCVLKKK